MSKISIKVNATHTDRKGSPLSRDTNLKSVAHTEGIHELSIEAQECPQSPLNIKHIDQVGLQISDILMYPHEPATVCFRKTEGDFVQHVITETPHTFTSEHRFAIETTDHVLWCYEKRTYTVKLTH